MATGPKLQRPACAQDQRSPLARPARPKTTAVCWADPNVMTCGPSGSAAMPRAMRAGARTRRQLSDSTGGKASSETVSTRCFEHPNDAMDPLGRLTKTGTRLLPLVLERGEKIGRVAVLSGEEGAAVAGHGFSDSR
jgi:hypothetical protein